MDIEKLTEVVDEAHRFLTAAQKMIDKDGEDNYAISFGCRESGALRRASMDLTRALADLRK